MLGGITVTKIHEVPEFSRLAIALINTGTTHGMVFGEPPPIDVDEILPDEFFDWDTIGIGEKEESKDGKINP